MQHISLYFDKYTKLEKELLGEKKLICKVLWEQIGLKMEESSVSIKSNAVIINLTPGERSFLLEKKEEFIEKLSKALGKNISRVS